MVSAGIMGASGYMGGEALRVLLEHPEVEVAWATSRSEAPIEHHHPNLLGSGIRCVHPDDIAPCDVAFLALPTAASLPAAERLLAEGCRVVDLGSAFRLEDRELWERTYGMSHSCWPLAEEAIYGIPELSARSIAEARLIANPGCFSSAAILALLPLIAEGLVELEHLVVTGLSGTTGVGAELSRAAHHPEIGNNLIAYNAVGHSHTLEIEQELARVAGTRVQVHFTPVYVPIVRGILGVCSGFLQRTLSRSEAIELYRDYYAEAPFVTVHDLPPEEGAAWQYRPYPWVSAVAGTNYCHVGLDIDVQRGRIVTFGALDSIGKGGAHVGVENMNLMFDLPRMSGLARRGSHP
jgi:N-acetyl-gamma-glutamyl-phosphate reductase